MSNECITAPTATDHLLSEYSQKLFAGAIDGQQYGSAWATLAELFGARSVQFLRHLRSSVDTLAFRTTVLSFDRQVRDDALARALAGCGADHGLCGVVKRTSAGADVLIVLRSATAFTEAECGWMELVTELARSALDLGEQLATPLLTLASAAQLARMFPTACLLTDDAGRCIERNDAFDRVLDALSGAVRAGRVVFEDPFLQDSWQQGLLEGRATAAKQSLLANAHTGAQWKVHLVPFLSVSSRAEKTPRHLMFALFEKFSDAPARTRTLHSSRPLTKAELEVLASLLLGQTAKVIARTRGASVNTVRSQITAILGKTGHRTQKELIASFSTSAFESMLVSDVESQP